jgi:hypothetical protein
MCLGWFSFLSLHFTFTTISFLGFSEKQSVCLHSWLPLGDPIFHASTYETKLISLVIHSLKEKIISFNFFKAEGRAHQLGFVPLLVSSCGNEVSVPSSMTALGFSH